MLTQGARVAIGDIDQSTRGADRAPSSARARSASRSTSRPRASFTAFLDQVEARLGPVDVLINNAGIMPVGAFVEESDATAKRMVDINVHGVIFGSKLALERFVPGRRGHLVNIASIAGKAGSPHRRRTSPPSTPSSG